MKYRVYGIHNFEEMPQVEKYLNKEDICAINVVGRVFPFKTNNYVVDELINWENSTDDPIFTLTFPQKDMLSPEIYNKMAAAVANGTTKSELNHIANEIRMGQNPHPAGQIEENIPEINGIKLPGIQHKYNETMLLFPGHGQTCHAYCTFCFRWPQFLGMDELKFAMKETELIVQYIKAHPEITDILITGGDPLIMSTDRLKDYILPLLEENIPTLQTIRIGSKSLSYWPHRFLSDKDSDELLRLFKDIIASGKHLAFMAHFNHPVELETKPVQEAIRKIRKTGAEIRTQSPIMKNINDSAEAWRDMWKLQVSLGCVPYYMFLARDTGAQDYFAIPLVKAWEIFQKAYQQVSGLCRTVRGPIMSAGPGKVQILGPAEIKGEKVLTLRFIQGRNPDWVHRPFFAEYNEEAIWLDDLKPAFGEERFFFEE